MVSPNPQTSFSPAELSDALDRITVESIDSADIYDLAEKTPLEPAPNLSQRLGVNVLLKREDLQPVFSFKLRGAYNKIKQLSDEDRARGVVAASAGNHAQGLALAAQHLQCHATIVMPVTTPDIKVRAVRNYGANVVLHGDAYDEARDYADKLTQQESKTFIHPYDDPDVIIGQGTVAKEILDEHPGPIEAIFVCTGGGGLLAGVAAYIKARRPEIKIISVEPEDSNCMQAAFAANERVVLDRVGIFADGVAVKQAGELTYAVAKTRVDECITVSLDEICAAIRDVFEDTRSVPEPAGALAVAGIKKYVANKNMINKTMVNQKSANQEPTNQGINNQGAGSLIATVSGANMNFDRLRYVAERAQVGEHREALLAVTIPEEKGSFLTFCQALGKRAITEFNYRYADNRAAKIFVGMAINGNDERLAIVKQLQDTGYDLVDLTDNELAKLHIRYMVGGHAPQVDNELLYRFEFPERPGALADFLAQVGSTWNISLFHYRNHGAAFGRVMVGMQVPTNEQAACEQAMDRLGYEWQIETNNPAYEAFLGH